MNQGPRQPEPSQPFNPFGAPMTDQSSMPQGGGFGLRPVYRSTRTLTATLKVFYILQMISAVVGIGVSIFSLNISAAELDSPELTTKMVAFIVVSLGFGCGNFLLFVANAIIHCIWTYRSNENCRALGAMAMTYSPGWAVGWFFVPFANLIMPYKVALEIYLESNRVDSTTQTAETKGFNQPLGQASGVAAESGSTGFIGWWWGCYILCGMLNNASLRLSLQDDADLVMTGDLIGLVAEIPGFIAAFLALKYVLGTFHRQEASAVRLGITKPDADVEPENPFARR